jgi:hypothetical protein
MTRVSRRRQSGRDRGGTAADQGRSVSRRFPMLGARTSKDRIRCKSSKSTTSPCPRAAHYPSARRAGAGRDRRARAGKDLAGARESPPRRLSPACESYAANHASDVKSVPLWRFCRGSPARVGVRADDRAARRRDRLGADHSVGGLVLSTRFEGREAWRSAGRDNDQVRAVHQSESRGRARSRRPADAARPRGRGDRIGFSRRSSGLFRLPSKRRGNRRRVSDRRVSTHFGRSTFANIKTVSSCGAKIRGGTGHWVGAPMPKASFARSAADAFA